MSTTSLPNVLIDGGWVDMHYTPSDVKHSTGFYVEQSALNTASPSGDLRASVKLACPSDFQAQWLAPGKTCKFYEYGSLRWGGVIAELERGEDGITIHAQGIGSVLKDWSALYDPGTGEQASFVPNDAVDYAVTQGAPFSRYGVDLGSTAIMLNNVGPVTDMLTLLTRAAILQGKRLHVASDGAITYVSTPTSPTWMMTPQPDYFSTADDQFVTTLRGFYYRYGEVFFRIETTGTPSSGTFTLKGNGATTAAIAFNATAGTMQTRIRSLGGPFATAAVTSSATGVWLATAYLGWVALEVDNNSLGGGTNPGVSIERTAVQGVVSATDATAATKFGVRQASIDLRPLGPMTGVAAQAYIDGRFALIGGRVGWTTQVQLTTKNLMYINGSWASPAYVKAGEMLMIPGIIDARSNATTRGSIQWVGQEVEVSYEPKPSAVVTPVGFVLRDFDGAFATPENPAKMEAA